jgi:hypothetical protein
LFTYNKRVVVGADFEPAANGVDVTAWYSGQPYHAMPISMAYIMNAMAKEVCGGGPAMTADGS